MEENLTRLVTVDRYATNAHTLQLLYITRVSEQNRVLLASEDRSAGGPPGHRGGPGPVAQSCGHGLGWADGTVLQEGPIAGAVGKSHWFPTLSTHFSLPLWIWGEKWGYRLAGKVGLTLCWAHAQVLGPSAGALVPSGQEQELPPSP